MDSYLVNLAGRLFPQTYMDYRAQKINKNIVQPVILKQEQIQHQTQQQIDVVEEEESLLLQLKEVLEKLVVNRIPFDYYTRRSLQKQKERASEIGAPIPSIGREKWKRVEESVPKDVSKGLAMSPPFLIPGDTT